MNRFWLMHWLYSRRWRQRTSWSRSICWRGCLHWRRNVGHRSSSRRCSCTQTWTRSSTRDGSWRKKSEVIFLFYSVRHGVNWVPVSACGGLLSSGSSSDGWKIKVFVSFCREGIGTGREAVLGVRPAVPGLGPRWTDGTNQLWFPGGTTAEWEHDGPGVWALPGGRRQRASEKGLFLFTVLASSGTKAQTLHNHVGSIMKVWINTMNRQLVTPRICFLMDTVS